jgi:hypothetical protein
LGKAWGCLEAPVRLNNHHEIARHRDGRDSASKVCLAFGPIRIALRIVAPSTAVFLRSLGGRWTDKALTVQHGIRQQVRAVHPISPYGLLARHCDSSPVSHREPTSGRAPAPASGKNLGREDADYEIEGGVLYRPFGPQVRHRRRQHRPRSLPRRVSGTLLEAGCLFRLRGRLT